MLALALSLLASFGFGDAIAAGSGRPQSLTEVAVGEPDLDTGRVIVAFAPGTPGAQKAALHASLGGRVVGELSGLGFEVVAVPDPAATRAIAAAYANSPLVTLARPDALLALAETPLTPGDTYYSLQWQHPAIQSPEAWEHSTGTPAQLITICDTGVSPTHPDLIPNLRGDLGRNTAGGGNDWTPIHYHGTAVAGAAAAAGNNGIGVAGVSWNAGIVPVRVSNRTDGAASLSAIAACIEYGADLGSAAINVSYTTYTDGGIDPVILAAGDYASARGSVLVIAAGNSNSNDAPGQDPESILYVAATNSGNGKASFSNYGMSVDVAAPGENVVSTYSEVSCIRRKCSVVLDDYTYISGTSFAAPIVAGAVALVADARAADLEELAGDSRSAFLRQAITRSACDLGAPGEDDLFGAGLLNVYDAIHGQSCSIVIPPPTISSVQVSPVLASVYVGGTQQFFASAVWSDGSMTDVSAGADWESLNPSIATVATGITGDPPGLALGVSAGVTVISATITADGVQITGQASFWVSQPPPAGTVSTVSSIVYSTSGGKSGDRNLAVTLSVEDDLDLPIEGAAVTIWLFNVSTGQLWSGTAPTGADGTVTFTLRSAPAGVYTTSVTSVQATGFTWDGQTPPNEFTK